MWSNPGGQRGMLLLLQGKLWKVMYRTAKVSRHETKLPSLSDTCKQRADRQEDQRRAVCHSPHSCTSYFAHRPDPVHNASWQAATRMGRKDGQTECQLCFESVCLCLGRKKRATAIRLSTPAPHIWGSAVASVAGSAQTPHGSARKLGIHEPANDVHYT
jgi:hypothetical protein